MSITKGASRILFILLVAGQFALFIAQIKSDMGRLLKSTKDGIEAQLQRDLAKGSDSYSIALILQSLTYLPEVTCINATTDGVVFFNYSIGSDCKESFFEKTLIIKNQYNSRILVSLNISFISHFKNNILALFAVQILLLFLWFRAGVRAENDKTVINEAWMERLRRAAHDIRSPISALKILSSSLEANKTESEMLKTVADRINKIANDLLMDNNSTTIETNKKVPSRNSKSQKRQSASALTNLEELIEAIVKEKRLVCGEGLQIVAEGHRGLTKVQADYDVLQRILSNLINNSIEAIGDKGEIKIVCSQQENTVQIEVIDNGKGIPPEVLPKIGQHGFSYGKENSSSSGSGLGLHAAIQAVESWQGSLKVESKVGLGTKIVISLNTSYT